MYAPTILFVVLIGGILRTSDSFFHPPPAPRPSPAIVSVENFRESHVCNGILVADTVVLTAAHCVNQLQDLYVRVGSSVVGFGGQLIAVLNNCPNSGFDFVTKNNDIAVLRLASPVTNVIPARLPTGDTLPDRFDGSTQGWGFNTQGILESRAVTRISDASCRSTYGINAITTSMVCLGFRSATTCLDDAEGSPLFRDNILVGINAALGACQPQGPPAIFTRISGTTIQQDIDACP